MSPAWLRSILSAPPHTSSVMTLAVLLLALLQAQCSAVLPSEGLGALGSAPAASSAATQAWAPAAAAMDSRSRCWGPCLGSCQS